MRQDEQAGPFKVGVIDPFAPQTEFARRVGGREPADQIVEYAAVEGLVRQWPFESRALFYVRYFEILTKAGQVQSAIELARLLLRSERALIDAHLFRYCSLMLQAADSPSIPRGFFAEWAELTEFDFEATLGRYAEDIHKLFAKVLIDIPESTDTALDELGVVMLSVGGYEAKTIARLLLDNPYTAKPLSREWKKILKGVL